MAPQPSSSFGGGKGVKRRPGQHSGQEQQLAMSGGGSGPVAVAAAAAATMQTAKRARKGRAVTIDIRGGDDERTPADVNAAPDQDEQEAAAAAAAACDQTPPVMADDY